MSDPLRAVVNVELFPGVLRGAVGVGRAGETPAGRAAPPQMSPAAEARETAYQKAKKAARTRAAP